MKLYFKDWSTGVQTYIAEFSQEDCARLMRENPALFNIPELPETLTVRSSEIRRATGEILRHAGKIEAIRFIRMLTSWGLRECKNYVESLA